MALDQNYSSIDIEQQRIKTALTDDSTNTEISVEKANELAKTFTDDVDSFQELIAKQTKMPELQATLSAEILEFLKQAVDLEKIRKLSSELEQSLDTFKANMDAHASWEKGKYQIKSGDTLSKIVVKALGLSSWKKDPQRVFSGIKRLHDSRSRTLPSLNSSGELTVETISSKPDNLDIGEWVNLNALESLKSDDLGSTEEMQWYANNSPAFSKAINRIIGKKESQTGSSETLDRHSEPKAANEVNAASSGTAAAITGGPRLNADAASKSKASRLLDKEEHTKALETQHLVEVEVVKTWMRGIHEENAEFSSQVNQIREEMTGWSGYGHTIELSNWIASAGNLLGGDFETEQSLDLDLSTEYLETRRSVEQGIATLIGEMRGGQHRGHGPLTLTEAWDKLNNSGNANFHAFKSSPEGHLFAKTALVGKEPTNKDNAQHLLKRAREIKSRIGVQEAEVYYQAILQQYPSTAQASSAASEKMTSGEKAADMGMEVFKVMTRLDSLAIMVATFGTGAAVNSSFKGSVAATRVASLMTKYPHLAKLVPGVQVLNASKGASVLSRLGVGTFNLSVELGKFAAYETVATKAGGPKAGYAVGMLCFFTPGLIHGFEQAGAVSLKKVIQTEGSAGLKRFGAHAAKEAGGALVLREAMVQGVERQAAAAGESVERAVIEATADDALKALGLLKGNGTSSARKAEKAAQAAASSGKKATPNLGGQTAAEAERAAAEKATQAAADRFREFVERLNAFRNVSTERAQQIASANREGAQRIKSMYGDNLKSFKQTLKNLRSGAVTPEQFSATASDYSQMVTREHGGALRKAVTTASTKKEQIAVMEAVIANAEKHVAAAEARLAILAQTKEQIFNSIGRNIKANNLEELETVTAKQIVERYKILRCFGSRVGGRDHALLNNKLATTEGRHEIKKLLTEILGVSETASKSECKKAWRKIYLQVHPDRLSQSSLTGEQTEVLGEIAKTLSGLKKHVMDNAEMFERLFTSAA